MSPIMLQFVSVCAKSYTEYIVESRVPKYKVFHKRKRIFCALPLHESPLCIRNILIRGRFKPYLAKFDVLVILYI